MQVLIVEDDAALGRFVERGLRMEGFDATWIGDGEAALVRAVERRPELVVLDLGLPEQDGTTVLAELRATLGAEVAVLVVTARGDTEERIRCLDLGADDVMLKPFSFHELTARCRVLTRRRSANEGAAGPVLRHGEVEMHRLERRVTQAGRAVDLTTTEYTLLESLLRRGGRACSRVELLREVWRKSEAEAKTNLVEVYVNYLRKKLRGGATVIRTVRGEGYGMGTMEVAHA
jgi:DNA-binding response OmpR family regulator